MELKLFLVYFFPETFRYVLIIHTDKDSVAKYAVKQNVPLGGGGEPELTCTQLVADDHKMFVAELNVALVNPKIGVVELPVVKLFDAAFFASL